MFAPNQLRTDARNRPTSLDAYRKQKSRGSATVALSRLEDLRPSVPATFIDDHRPAFLSASEHHHARALCLLLNNRPVSAGLHHLSSLIFRSYAQSDAIARLAFIWAHLSADDQATARTVHVNTTIFFRSVIEAFYREHARETQGELSGRFSVVDPAASILGLFHALGYEARFNTIVSTYNASLLRSDTRDRQLVERRHAPIDNR